MNWWDNQKAIQSALAQYVLHRRGQARVVAFIEGNGYDNGFRLCLSINDRSSSRRIGVPDSSEQITMAADQIIDELWPLELVNG